VLITHLKLQNFKSYVEAAIAFQPGTNAIIGANGAGKSTLLEAIGLVLFDHRESGISLAGLLREGAATATAMVRLVSSQDERCYEVERKFSAKSTTSYRVYDVELGRQVLAEGLDDVLTWLREHLCGDPLANLDVLFENTVGVPQGTFTAPFLQPPAARKAIFDPLLQVDAYQKSSDNLRPTIRHLESQSNTIRQEMARLEERLTDLPRLQEEEELLEQDLRGLAGQVETVGEQLASLEKELARLDETERVIRGLVARLEQAQAEQGAQQRLLTNARRELAEAEAAQAEAEAARAGHEAYLAADSRLRELERQRSQRDALWQERSRLQQQEARLAARVEQLGKDLEAIAEAASRLQALRPLVERQMTLEAELREAEGRVRRAAEARERAEQAREELALAKAEAERIRKALAEAAELEQAIGQAEARAVMLAEMDREARHRQAALQAEGQRLRQQMDALADAQTARCPVCEAELTPQHRAELLERNTRLLRELQAEEQAVTERAGEIERESQSLEKEVKRHRLRLRQLPSVDDEGPAEEAVRYRQAAHDRAMEALAALERAAEQMEDCQARLARLGDPRREAQRHEDQLREKPAKEAETRQQKLQQEELRRSLERLEEELAPLAEVDRALSDAQASRDEHQPAHDSYLANSQIAQEWPSRNQRLEQLTQEGAKLAQQVADLRLQHQQAAAGYQEAGHALVRQNEAAARRKLAGLEAQQQARQDRLGVVRQNVAQLKAMQADLARRQAAARETDSLRALVDTVRETLRQAGPLITQQRVRQISSEASNLYGDIMGNHTARLHWSEDYELSLETKGVTRSFRQLSGGEQMSAALALRLALLRQVSRIDVAFFDEPTAHLDPERRESLADRITQIKGFSQLFVISHDDTFERAAQSYIRITKDESGSHPERT